jgi:23S rRNA pseudouridine2605 synthase
MTFKDKPKRPGGKPAGRDTRPKTGDKPARSAAPKAAAAETAGDGKAERISKVMARAGVASRRDIERMIMDGRVTLNGKPLETPVVNVTLTDKIEVDGIPIRGIERTRLWLYHKPAGLVTTNADPEGRPTVFDNLPDELPRVMSIGRLDINTEGLLLLTNDGGLARSLELPTTGWLRRYRVRAHGEIDQDALDKLKEGIAVDGVLYGSIDATLDRTQGPMSGSPWACAKARTAKSRT